MNNLKIVVGGHYKIQDESIHSKYTKDVYVLSKNKMTVGFFSKTVVPGITYSNFEDGTFEKIMTEDEFKLRALYRVN